MPALTCGMITVGTVNSSCVSPAATPREIVLRLNAAINQAFADPGLRGQLEAAGLEPVGGTPEAFGKLIAGEAAKWAPIIQRTGARLD